MPSALNFTFCSLEEQIWGWGVGGGVQVVGVEVVGGGRGWGLRLWSWGQALWVSDSFIYTV